MFCGDEPDGLEVAIEHLLPEGGILERAFGELPRLALGEAVVPGGRKEGRQGATEVLVTISGPLRMNAAEEMSGLLTGALLLLALTGSVLPKFLSTLRPRRQAA